MNWTVPRASKNDRIGMRHAYHTFTVQNVITAACIYHSGYIAFLWSTEIYPRYGKSSVGRAATNKDSATTGSTKMKVSSFYITELQCILPPRYHQVGKDAELLLACVFLE